MYGQTLAVVPCLHITTTMTKKELKARLATLKETLAKPTMTNATAKEVLENNIKKLTEQINELPDDEPEAAEKLDEKVEKLEEKVDKASETGKGKPPGKKKAKYHKGQTFKGYWKDTGKYDEIKVLNVYPPGHQMAPSDGKDYGYDIKTNATGEDNIYEAKLTQWIAELSKTKPKVASKAKSTKSNASSKPSKLVEDPKKGGKYKIIGKDGKEITSSNEEFCHALLKFEREKREARKKSGNKSRERSPLLKAEDQVADAVENIISEEKEKDPIIASMEIINDFFSMFEKALKDKDKFPKQNDPTIKAIRTLLNGYMSDLKKSLKLVK